ncbi:MAG: SulP family inorganic anion transporter [Chloroflexota bacterium]
MTTRIQTPNKRPTSQNITALLPSILSSLSFGIVAGLLTVFLEVSIAALIFSGRLESFVGLGTGFFLFGALVMGLIVGLMSFFKPVIIYPQEAPVAILAIIAASLSASMSAASNETLFATVVATIMVSTMVTGLCFWIMGRLHLGQLVRFIPYPVGGGFLGGTGWLLVTGGISVMTDTPLGPALFSLEVLEHWLPGLLFAVALVFILRRFSHFLLLPSLLIGGIGLFYLAIFMITGSFSGAAAAGWLLGPFPTGRLWEPETLLIITQADWTAVFSNILHMSTILLVSVISLLLNASGLEIITRTDIDLDKELQSVGIANIAAGLGGSPAGFHSLSLSALGHQLGVNSRLGGILAAGLVGIVLLLGADMLSLFPKLIAGGFLIYLGFSFLEDWVYETWFKLSWIDYLLIWVILLMVVFVGFLEAVGLGIVVAIGLFVLDYSRIDAARYVLTGAERRSSVIHPPLYEQLLERRGEQIYLLVLHGFLFFGSAHQLIKRIRTRLENPELPKPRYLLLEFRLVTGIDSSATFAFTRLLQLLQGHNVQVVVTQQSETVGQLWKQAFLHEASELVPPTFASLDDGLAWCESQIIDAFVSVGLDAQAKSFLAQVAAELQQDAPTVDWLNHLNPSQPPTELPGLTLLKNRMARIELEAGQPIVRQGQQADGLYLLETGRAIIQKGDDAKATMSGALKQSVLIGGEEWYAKRPFANTILTTEPSTVQYLSEATLKQLAQEAPDVAIAIHRVMAAHLSRKLFRANHLVEALEK